MTHTDVMMFACLFLLGCSAIAAIGAGNARNRHDASLWKEQPALYKFWIIITVLCFAPLFFKAFFIVVL